DEEEEIKLVMIFARKVPINLLHVRHSYVDVDGEDWKFETFCALYEIMLGQ
ncbi:hypothetical protein BGZ90_004385, partial [Linnemannia elongata]